MTGIPTRALRLPGESGESIAAPPEAVSPDGERFFNIRADTRVAKWGRL